MRAALPKLPDVMQSTDHKASAVTRAAVDLAEAILLQGRVGEVFDAAVLDVDGPHDNQHGSGRAGGTVSVDEPPVRARCDGVLPLGERVKVRLVTADPQQRLVRFAVAVAVADGQVGR